jgi:hypothetical protein
VAGAARLRSIGEGELPSFDPTAGEGASLQLTWDLAGHLVQIDKKVGEFTYRKTLAWTGDYPTSITAWVKL